MGVHVIRMPDIGEGIAEVELVVWRVQPGDTVAEDQILADVMTDKATVEIPSPVAGSVLALGGAEGRVLAVGAELIRIEVADAAGAALAPAPAVVEATAAPRAATPVPAGPVPGRAAGERPIASPALRRRAWELGIDLHAVAGSGPGGRILQADLAAHAARAPVARHAPAAAPARADEQLQLTGLRRRIAQKMQESKRRIPHYTYVEEVDVTELEALRAQLNARHGAERGRLTLLPLLARAIVLAVGEFPQINARFDDEAGVVTRVAAVHLGIATQTDAGLMVPVLRDAGTRDLWANAAEIARLAGAARAGKALRDELTGSTITLTSLGALGGIVSTPVINHPEVAIVGVNRVVARPVIRDGAVVARQMMNLSSSFDHRVVDGMHAAQFVQALRGLLECPALLFVD
ncbi:MAG TPA: dihydrolipoamide acetyltransferase family protein [Burkholderiaceae bacterium]|nr:dihydrolipoamide acetyltransferase family protein [Burkholderiaceae bacterium]